MLIDRAPSEKVKIGLAVGAIVLIIVAAIIARLREAAKQSDSAKAVIDRGSVFRIGRYSFNITQAFTFIVLLMALFASWNYAFHGDLLDSDNYDSVDMLENYVGAKYFDELGYNHLIPALVIADDDGERFCRNRVRGYSARQGTDFKTQLISHAIERRDEIVPKFTPSRWKSFVHDVTYLQTGDENISCGGWRSVLRGRGFEGTPAKVLLTRPLANLVPVEQVKLIAYLDLVFFVAMFAVVAWAFGLQTMAFAWLFISLSFSLRLNHITYSVLHYDWVAMLVVGVGLTKKNRPGIAGLVLGYATAMNYACGMWLLCVVAKIIHQLITRRDFGVRQFWKRVSVHQAKTLLGFVVALLVLFSAATVRYGISTQSASIADSMTLRTVSPRDTGLVVTASYRGETDLPNLNTEKVTWINQFRGVVTGVGLFLMVLLGLFFTKTKTYYGLGLGVLPYFWVFLVPFDFFVCLVVSVVIHACDLSKARNVFGLILIFSIELFTNASQHLNPGESYFLIGVLSVLLATYTFGIFASLGLDWWKSRISTRS